MRSLLFSTLLSAGLFAGCDFGPDTSQPPATLASVERFTYEAAIGDGLTLSAIRAGTGRRVILVHGTPGEGVQLAELVAERAGAYEAIAIDRPGFGQSEPDGAVVAIADQAAAIYPLLEDVDGKKPILFGHSLGGPIVAWAAAERPDDIGAIVLAAAALDPGLEDVHPMQYVGAVWPFRALLPRELRNANDELIPLEGDLETLSGMLDRITAPVVVIHGTEDDLVPVANVPFMRAAFADGPPYDEIVLEGANHFLPWERKSNLDDSIARAIAMAEAAGR